jgi:3D (Asp-Asp-Asp) domain-containing protein
VGGYRADQAGVAGIQIATSRRENGSAPQSPNASFLNQYRNLVTGAQHPCDILRPAIAFAFTASRAAVSFLQAKKTSGGSTMVWGKLCGVTLLCVCASACSDNATAQTATFSGTASFYNQHGRVATGGYYKASALTCAHRTLPFGTRLRVTDRKTKRSVVVTVNDRGPFVRGRNLDLSMAAARALGMTGRGLINYVAQVEYKPRASIRTGRKGRHRDA